MTWPCNAGHAPILRVRDVCPCVRIRHTGDTALHGDVCTGQWCGSFRRIWRIVRRDDHLLLPGADERQRDGVQLRSVVVDVDAAVRRLYVRGRRAVRIGRHVVGALPCRACYGDAHLFGVPSASRRWHPPSCGGPRCRRMWMPLTGRGGG